VDKASFCLFFRANVVKNGEISAIFLARRDDFLGKKGARNGMSHLFCPSPDAFEGVDGKI
jgi:homoaconitase/3-isopropylmalate dehydratase large subunit